MSTILIETVTWYWVTWVVVIARLISRRLLRGSLKKLKIDDYLVLFAMMTDTVFLVGVNIIDNTSTNLVDPSQPPLDLTPEDIQERIFGSKLVFVIEQMQLFTTWTVKITLLIQYARLTNVLKKNLFVKIVGCYVVVGFVVMQLLLFFAWCWPFNQYWAVPAENTQCSTYEHHLITNAVINISSDLMIISIPIPVLLHLRNLPLSKKAMIYGIFAFGTFTILSAVLNKYWSFREPFGSQWIYWYVRESSTALIASNLPCTWTLIQRVFKLQSFYETESSKQETYTRKSDQKRRSKLSGATVESSETELVPWAGVEESQTAVENQTTINPEANATQIGTETELLVKPEPAEVRETYDPISG